MISVCILYMYTKHKTTWKCKNICGTQFSRYYLFSARSYMVNYEYYLVCLCFGIFGVKYFAYTVI